MKGFEPQPLLISDSINITMGLDWNKGLTKETDERVRRQSEAMKKSYKEGRIEPWNKETKGLTRPNKTSFKKGNKPWNTGGTRSEKTKEKIRQKLKEYYKKHPKIVSDKTRELMSKNNPRCWKGKKRPEIRGKNNPACRPEIQEKIKKYWWKPGQEPWNKGLGDGTHYTYDFFIKRIIMQFWDLNCWACGSKRSIVIHHLDRKKNYSGWDNLIPLCRSCHIKLHNNVWKKDTKGG